MFLLILLQGIVLLSFSLCNHQFCDYRYISHFSPECWGSNLSSPVALPIHVLPRSISLLLSLIFQETVSFIFHEAGLRRQPLACPPAHGAGLSLATHHRTEPCPGTFCRPWEFCIHALVVHQIRSFLVGKTISDIWPVISGESFNPPHQSFWNLFPLL